VILVLMVLGYLVGKAAEYVIEVAHERDLRDAALPQLPAATAREIRRERKAGRLVLK
jgi:hypothetical protein